MAEIVDCVVEPLLSVLFVVFTKVLYEDKRVETVEVTDILEPLATLLIVKIDSELVEEVELPVLPIVRVTPADEVVRPVWDAVVELVIV